MTMTCDTVEGAMTSEGSAMPTLDFHSHLEMLTGKKVHLRLNQNRSTMLSVREERSVVRVSLHRMFLEAPADVIEALARFIKGKRREANTKIQAYVEQNLRVLDYSDRIDQSKLTTSGQIYDLLDIYEEVNREYFQNRHDLLITWYGTSQRRRRSHLTFGLYHDATRLVKIHRILDNPLVPRYFVAFVVYHEMLHHECPTVIRPNGRNQIHHREFRSREREFAEYHMAEQWLKRNQSRLMRGAY